MSKSIKSGGNKRPATHKDDKDKPIDEKKLLEEVKKADEERKEAIEKAKKDYEKLINRYKHRDRYKDKVTPWLLTRYAPTDLGLRPIPGGVPYWASPDISVESSSPLGNPVAGEENFLHVRIFNLGAADAAPVQVDFYWADPSLGLGPANMNLIGSEWVEVKSLHSKDVRCNKPWVPEFVNNGHECAMVNCTNLILDPILHPFEPVLDRHVGQRNLHVEMGAPGQAFKFLVNLNNIFPFALTFQIIARFDRLRIGKRSTDENLTDIINHAVFHKTSLNTALELKSRMKADSPQFKTAQRFRKLMLDRSVKNESSIDFEESDQSKTRPKIQSRITDYSSIIFDRTADKHLGERLIANSQLVDKRSAEHSRDNYFILHRVEMKPFEQKQLEVEITIPNDARKGEIILFRLSQETDNLTVGGYIYAFKITDR